MLAWIHHHQRSSAVADALGGTAVFMPWARPGLPPWRRTVGWLRSALRTVAVLWRLAPGTVCVVQVPPVFAALVAHLARRRRPLVLDLHSGAVNDPNWAWSAGLLRWVGRRCDGIVVTTTELLDPGQFDPAPVWVMHDPAVDPGPPTSAAPALPGGGPVALFPASGAADEPLDALTEAAASLEGEVRVVVTGSHGSRFHGTAVHAVGWLPRAQYEALLADADVVLALTTREATMQCAAYEALARGKPIVCSATAALTGVLGGAAVPAANDGPSLADAVRRAVADPDPIVEAGRRVTAGMSAEADQVLAAIRRLGEAPPARR